MAKRDFHNGISRRRLLTSTAAITAAAIVPAEAATPAVMAQAQSAAALTPLRPALNVCATTARRLADIKRRNDLRRQAGLPLLGIAKELRRMKNVATSAEFAAFAEVHREAAFADALTSWPGAKGNPCWRPTWGEGVAFRNEVDRVLRQQFRERSL